MQNLLTLKQTADYIGISYHTIKKHWPRYMDYGVKPVRYMGRKNIMFRKAELDQMISKWRIV